MNTASKLSELRQCDRCGRITQTWLMNDAGHCEFCQQEQRDLAAIDEDAKRWREQREEETP